jgi:hypothetical protein
MLVSALALAVVIAVTHTVFAPRRTILPSTFPMHPIPRGESSHSFVPIPNNLGRKQSSALYIAARVRLVCQNQGRSFAMKFPLRITLLATSLAILLHAPMPAMAQAPAGPPELLSEQKKEQHGLTLYAGFDASTSSDGLLLDLTSTAGYIFNRHFSFDAGFPVSLVRGTTSTGTKYRTNAVGDAFTHFRLAFPNRAVNYVTTLTVTVPTGSADKGQTTGRPNFDWGHNFSREFGRLSPFGNVGLATTVYSNHYLQRPYLTNGKVMHFELGTGFDLGHSFSVSASAYEVVGWGEQKVFSRIVTKTSGPRSGKKGRPRPYQTAVETIGPSDLVKDNGFNAALDMNPTEFVDLEVAFNRSTHAHENTLSFSIGFNLTPLLHRPRSRR